ncbi:MAG TPA: MerR family transcriptional regulator [Pseudomonadales bacterium]|nr:MerR family transcriptional regulator [Pseudomonadales bacterium]
MTQSSNAEQTQNYRIGAVARLTGISVDRLRAWERRYAVVETRRTESLGRIYTREDVDRLSMIKQLVDLGNPISSVAQLDDSQLRERLQQDNRSHQQLHQFATTPVRVVAFGSTLVTYMDAATDRLHGVQIAGSFRHFSEFQRAVGSLAPDVLVLEYPGVYEETVEEVRDLLQRAGTRRAVIVCGFGRRETLEALRGIGATILRSPVSLEELEIACRFDANTGEAGMAENISLQTDLGDTIPTRRFDDDALVRLASMSRSVECECPEHLITLIGSLSAFEAYSANCKNRNPNDAALHAYLHRVTAHARALVEEALENVAEVEGLTR